VRTGSRLRLYYAIAIVWAVLTVSMASWWMYFGLSQAAALDRVSGPKALALGDVQRMLVWEGVVLIGLLVAGGVALVIAIRREHERQRAIESFFMAFTHELKTSLASLQLQAESFVEDWPEAAGNPNLDRLMKDALQLQLQLENSLYFAQPDGRMLIEPLDVRQEVARVAQDWPELTLRVDGDARALADARALDSVFRNVLQNAVVHGGATEVRARIVRDANVVSIRLEDNGRGAPPEIVRALGAPFARVSPQSGTGVGLFVSRQLMQRMRGNLQWQSADPAGFLVRLDLPEAV
jgi:signal transduction histidine kinase